MCCSSTDLCTLSAGGHTSVRFPSPVKGSQGQGSGPSQEQCLRETGALGTETISSETGFWVQARCLHIFRDGQIKCVSLTLPFGQIGKSDRVPGWWAGACSLCTGPDWAGGWSVCGSVLSRACDDGSFCRPGDQAVWGQWSPLHRGEGPVLSQELRSKPLLLKGGWSRS